VVAGRARPVNSLHEAAMLISQLRRRRFGSLVPGWLCLGGRS
jgi:hypothetical protein